MPTDQGQGTGHRSIESVLAAAISDPGHWTPRGDNYEEPIISWETRAVLIALDSAGFDLVKRRVYTPPKLCRLEQHYKGVACRTKECSWNV